MVFSSIIFLFVFLPGVLSFYYLFPGRYRNLVLLAASYLFYLWGGGWFLMVLALSTLMDFVLGLRIGAGEDRGRKALVAASVAVNLALLAYFKYANFFVEEAGRALVHLGLGPVGWTKVALPIGISFFTFHKISYIVDVYRGRSRALESFADFALYIAFFPQLIAGPIVRFHEISDQLRGRKETPEAFYLGVQRFSWGLIKKVLFANPCGEIADSIFALQASSLDTPAAWLGVFAYTMQIYFDFSGYSDMAIGLGQLFGFKLPENFNRPYSSVSVTDFWRRWHMSLSRFFRDYLYLPLGGNRRGEARTYFNLWTVFVLCGLWHGANWTFLVWGVYHGTLLMFERMAGLRAVEAGRGSAVRRAATFVLVMVGWVFFRSSDMAQALSFLHSMFLPSVHALPMDVLAAINHRNLFFLSLASLSVFLPRDFTAAGLLAAERRAFARGAIDSALAVLVLYSVAFITSGSYNPFIYFQF